MAVHVIMMAIRVKNYVWSLYNMYSFASEGDGFFSIKQRTQLAQYIASSRCEGLLEVRGLRLANGSQRVVVTCPHSL